MSKTYLTVFQTTYTVYVYPKPKKFLSETPKNGVKGESQIRVFPNPVSGLLTVENAEEIQKIVLIDGTGKELEALTVDNLKTATIDLSSRPMGLYSLKIVTKTQTKMEQVIKK